MGQLDPRGPDAFPSRRNRSLLTLGTMTPPLKAVAQALGAAQAMAGGYGDRSWTIQRSPDCDLARLNRTSDSVAVRWLCWFAVAAGSSRRFFQGRAAGAKSPAAVVADSMRLFRDAPQETRRNFPFTIDDRDFEAMAGVVSTHVSAVLDDLTA